MPVYTRPVIVTSRCLGFDNCRFNGEIIRSEIIDKLKKFADFKTVCPEVEIGLGIPRRPIRIVKSRDNVLLLQPANNRDHTKKMTKFVDSYLDSLAAIDGFILKSKSPSCGIGDVKIYSKAEASPVVAKGNGFFGEQVISRFSHLAIEDDTRLINPKIRNHFLTKLFTLANFRKLYENGNIKDLMDFHAKNKYLLMAYNQKELRELGRIIGTQKGSSRDDVYKSYQTHLQLAFNKGPKFSSYINILHHTFGYVSKNLTVDERHFFLDMVEMYREDRTPLEACLALVKSWIVRFDVEYLANQTIFEPYPVELGDTFDTKRTRNYWK